MLLHDFKSTSVFDPVFFIARDLARDAIVVSIRGTMSVTNAVTDLAREYTPWQGGRVHSGIKALASSFVKNTSPNSLHSAFSIDRNTSSLLDIR